jgi:hypothetical protein
VALVVPFSLGISLQHASRKEVAALRYGTQSELASKAIGWRKSPQAGEPGNPDLQLSKTLHPGKQGASSGARRGADEHNPAMRMAAAAPRFIEQRVHLTRDSQRSR